MDKDTFISQIEEIADEALKDMSPCEVLDAGFAYLLHLAIEATGGIEVGVHHAFEHFKLCASEELGTAGPPVVLMN